MTRDLSNYFKELEESGYTDKELSLLLRDIFLEYQPEHIHEESLSNALNPWIEANETEYLSSEELREEILDNTFQKHFLKDFEHYTIVKNHLLKLSLYDKIITRNRINYFFLIDMLLANYVFHLKALIKWDELYETNDPDIGGVALSKSTTPEKIISSQYNSLNTVKKSMPENNELQVRENVYDEYLRSPSSANLMLHTTSLLGGIKSLTKEENEHLLNSQKVINSRVPFEKNTIYKSANILILLFFRKESQFVKILKPEKHISINKAININAALILNIFGAGNSLNTKNFSKMVQVKTYFSNANTPLYEFQTSKNKFIHPMFEETNDNKKHWNDILEYLKGKIPPKRS